MTVSSHIENYNQHAYWTSSDRNFLFSARLHLQHFLYQNTIGYLLDPAVEKAVTSAQQPLKVADLGCGNGIWLTELNSELSKKNITAQLDGFDINPIHFPAPAYLPPAVTLQKLDILANPFPAHLLGTYDLVHIRSFGSTISGSDLLTPTLSVASSLLKPGGYLQWEENRGDIFLVEAPNSKTPTAACESVMKVLKDGLKAKGISYAWIDELDTPMTGFGFQNVRLQKYDKRKLDYKAWTDAYLIILEDLTPLFPRKADAPDAPLSREAWFDMLSAAVKETEKGVVFHQSHIITAVGQKPLA
ncbi:hypothetical protein BO83DRAFT_447866 [Aspergillus eucalypticola CBS 122712]|uniref:Methyltransferase domain-containing protein n=1 Tax=Aspergillus eucalypticola (strain CBS 122712 / IBT 29274) TaxID=1448314 RepID=A0A317V6J6_ASPEC|nr:uncharacterized protein BO83DRAFT_447866 [Aspergillus eucalypticola CBS 122712]PWY69984.1 hypothetical protein BO83DRAFT_447866 [Aspergillus eucalypticola CBS 122712]